MLFPIQHTRAMHIWCFWGCCCFEVDKLLIIKDWQSCSFQSNTWSCRQGSFSDFWTLSCSIVAMIYFHLNKTQKFAIHVLWYSVLQFIKSAIADSVCGWHFIKMSLHHIVIFVTGFYFMERTLFIFFFFLFWFSLSMTFRLFAKFLIKRFRK